MLASVYFTDYVRNRSRFNRRRKKPPIEVPQVSTIVKVATDAPSVPVNIFTGTRQGIIGFTNTQVLVLVEDRYDSQESVLYWKLTDIKYWFQLKAKISASRGEVSHVDRRIKFLQEMAWWVTNLTPQSKIIDLNSFKNDILDDAIEDTWLDFEYTRYGKGVLSNPK